MSFAYSEPPIFISEPRAPRKVVVGIAEMAVSRDADEVLITFALGSCLGVSVFDPAAQVAGLLHLMLPQAANAADKEKPNPFMFADTGVPQLFRAAYSLGAKKERMIVVAAGGASFGLQNEQAIGQRNIAMLKKVLWKNGVLLKQQDMGGSEPRTMSVDVRSGTVSLGVGVSARVLWEGSEL